MDLVNQIEELMEELSISIKELRKSGEALSQKERDYKVSLTQEIAKLRAEKYPVTLISQMIYGIEPVATKRFDRDMAQAKYTANQEHINVTKLKLRIIESQLNREWSNLKNE